ncbi:hypothetical protein ACJO2E_02120 [Marinobacter sp. M1N3S26]|uniref:hypothetical protein n=1 Tax=unclassified Marinobacter TaxID=83889 RepID=UPI00387A91D6
MNVLLNIALITAVSLSGCSAPHDIIESSKQSSDNTLDKVSSFNLGGVSDANIDNTYITIERLQFSEDADRYLVQIELWNVDTRESQHLVFVSNTKDGSNPVRYNPDDVLGKSYRRQLAGFLSDDRLFIYGDTIGDSRQEHDSPPSDGRLNIFSLEEPENAQAYNGRFGGTLSNDRFLLGDSAIEWKTGEIHQIPSIPTRRGSLTQDDWFYFGERQGQIHRFHIPDQSLESWPSDLLMPLPKPSADRNYIVAVGAEGKCSAWEVTAQEPIGNCTPAEGPVNPDRQLAMHPKENVFAIASGTSVFLYDLAPFKLITEFDLSSEVHHVGITQGNRLVITTLTDVQIWDVNSWKLIAQQEYTPSKTQSGSTGWGYAFQHISNDGHFVAVKEVGPDGNPNIGIYKIP